MLEGLLGGRARGALLLLLTICVAGLAAGPALAAPLPDPLATGPYGVKKVEYNAGNLMITIPPSSGGASQTFPQPLQGSITYPDTPGPWKVLVFMHGRHSTCITSTGSETSPPITSPDVTCADTDNPDGTENTTNIRSYEGYDYLSSNLASHGYVVMSVAANTVVSFDNTFSYDAGANARSQILAASLDLLYRWNNGAGPVVAGDDSQTVGTKLAGKMEMQRIGLMGHSRGGEGVTDFIRFNRLRPNGGRIYNLQAVLALAPIDSQKQVPYGTNFGTLLPACDGDVSTLAGANAFERSKYANPSDPFARVQWYVQGTDHDYYNTIWTNDDGASYSGTGAGADVACGEDKPKSVRLYPSDQRKVGLALMASFLRDYLGMESEFDPYMTGAARIPDSACPTLRGVACDQLVKTSYLAPAGQRQDVVRPEADNPLSADSAGGALSGTGFDIYDSCDEDRDQQTGQQIKPCYPNPQPGSTVTPTNNQSTNRSFGRQLTLAWSSPATLRAGLVGAARDASRFGTLSMRAAVNWADLRNPVSDGTNPTSAMQDFDVTLVDRKGARSTVRAAKYGTALEPSLGSFRRHVVLNGLRIPLSAFSGVDLKNLDAIELGFGGATPTGSIQLADVAFQEPPSAAPAATTSAQELAAPAPLPGPKRVDAVAEAGVTTLPSTTTCLDTTPPTAGLRTLALRKGTLRLSGVASDQGCAATATRKARTGAVKRVQITVSHLGKGGCRYLAAGGHLTKPRSCTAPLSLIAKGTSPWSLALAGKLPHGTYRVLARAVDGAGNLQRTVAARTLHVA